MNTGKAFTKPDAPLPQKRLFSGEGWKPLDKQAVRQILPGIREMKWWDNFDVASNQYCSDKPMSVRDRGEGPNLKGKQRGTVVIVGYFGAISDRHYWVSKCECGTFALLSEKTLLKKPHSPQHKCPVCQVLEARRYREECEELAEAHGLNFQECHLTYRALKEVTGASKHNSFGLIHFIRRLIKDNRRKTTI